MIRWFQIDYVSRIKEENAFHNPLRYTDATAHLPSMVARTNIKADSKSEAKSSFLDVATDVTEIVRILPLEMVFDGLIYEYVDTKDPEGIQRDIMHYNDKGYKYRKIKNSVGDYHLYINKG